MQREIMKSRLSYTASEVAGQLVFCVISFYLLKFYTDVYGISAAAAGGILLVARCIDAIDAPVWGVIFDRTASRWGKSRPWFLWLCVPYAITGVLTFTTFHLGPTAKIAYALCTYVSCSVLYTGINTPVTSILASLTPSSDERMTLTTFRMIGSKGGVLFVNLTLLKAVQWFGHGDAQRGFMIAVPVYACGTIVLYLTAFRNLRETVESERVRVPFRTSLRAVRGNSPWLIIFFSSLLFWIAFTARIAAAPYFFEYVMHNGAMTSVADSLDVVSLASILLLPWFCRISSKRTVWATSLAWSVAGQIVMGFGVRSHSMPIVLAGWIVGFLACGIAMAIPFSILSDSVDFGEWKSGIRATGLLTAVGAAFCLKAGSGLGGALPAWIMAHFHYVANATQSSRSLAGIDLSFLWLPALCYGLAILPVLFYARYERMEPEIQCELERRRAIAAAVAAEMSASV
ncbi:sugar (Glycoside-Pentoside-Hexuronide) transporter [Bryocella elongata]|uniref:Sugar (Glycoside-Pentoside-Hexuronide) transporter n=1 Tax=Bryocella elongata TaxID=863522 RepID=A0A1H5WRQ6_9BACT|nr:MFS transporter [Bryocella elongata]SEG02104.1 sugar (Glycoside-Pentoside-Hexuronide) transporter [Bryocella elongata]